MKNIVIDLDNTITSESDAHYDEKQPRMAVVEKLHMYKSMGFHITIFTSRGMRTYGGDIGKINIHILPHIISWLDRHKVPYDSIMVGKSWCGFDGFYVDDKAIRPSEFESMSYEDILALLAKENRF